MNLCGHNINDLELACISHQHQDHNRAVNMLRKHQPQCTIIHGTPHERPGWSVHPVKVKHDDDVPSYGYVVSDHIDNVKLVYLTDLHCVYADDGFAHCLDADVIVLEFNHDLERLADAPYPADRIERVYETHMNNEAAGELLSLLADCNDNLKWVVPWHLSEQTNQRELVLLEISPRLSGDLGVEMSEVTGWHGKMITVM
jgi:ribonuclease BN (tRNA processing enzyme)